jgi:hypothetical protein
MSEYLHGYNSRETMRLFAVANATQLPKADSIFDGAFVCWMLEHVSSPRNILFEILRVLKPRSPVYINEVFNPLFQVSPENPVISTYWQQFNELQKQFHGDPCVGIQLGSLFYGLGFQNIQTQIHHYHLDQRNLSLRNQMLEYWYNLLLSASAELLKSERIDQSLLRNLEVEFKTLSASTESVFLFGWIKAQAQSPERFGF